jgi:hypothetical protein
MYKGFNPPQDLDGKPVSRPTKGDANVRNKRRGNNKKRPGTKVVNRSRPMSTNSHRRKTKNDVSFFVDKNDADADGDIDVDKSLSAVFSSLHNIQNQVSSVLQNPFYSPLTLRTNKLERFSNITNICG